MLPTLTRAPVVTALTRRSRRLSSSPRFLVPEVTSNALLVGSASTMREFCYACHGDSAPGASTNVQAGVFDGGRLDRPVALQQRRPTSMYVTESTFNASAQRRWLRRGRGQLGLGNRLQRRSTTQSRRPTAWSRRAFSGVPATVRTRRTYLICTSCHDPHGSSNYRLLKDSVNGVATGGYNSINATGGTAPAGWVFSTETNYPQASEGGWMKGPDGAAQMAAYRPDYTGGTPIAAGISATPGASLSAWCSACHTGYNNISDAPATKDYGSYEATVGAQVRHRHPVDIPLTAGDAIIQTPAMEFVLDARIPLEATVGAADYRSNNVGCLTCHLAHGSSQDMTGWAAASLVNPTRHRDRVDSRDGRHRWRRTRQGDDAGHDRYERSASCRQPRRVRALPQQVVVSPAFTSKPVS